MASDQSPFVQLTSNDSERAKEIWASISPQETAGNLKAEWYPELPDDVIVSDSDAGKAAQIETGYFRITRCNPHEYLGILRPDGRWHKAGR